MKQYLLLAAVLLATFTCSYAQPRSGKELWRFQSGDKIMATPLLTEQYLYYGNMHGHVFCHRLEDGKLMWTAPLGKPVSATAGTGEGKVFVSCEDGKIYALDTANGRVLWTFATKGEKAYDLWDYYRSAPVYYKGNVFAGSGDGNIYCINASNGRKRWHFATNGIVHADPVIDNDTVYIGSFDGYFYALKADNGRLIWKFKTVGDRSFPLGEIQKAALVTGNALYFGSRDYNIYALDKKTGTGLWNMKERGSWVTATPFEKDGQLYFGTSDTHAFYSLGNLSGKIRWKTAIPMRSYTTPATSDTLIFAGCHNGMLYGFGQHSGEVKWRFQTAASNKHYATVYAPDGHFRKDFRLYGDDATNNAAEQLLYQLGAILSSPVVKNGVIYFGSTDGCMYAVRIDG